MELVPKKPELNEEEIRIAQSIEGLKFLENRDKVFLLLIWRNLKSASPVSLFSPSDSATKELEVTLQQAKLLYKAGPIITAHMRGLNPGIIYYIANNQSDLDLLSELWFGDHEKDSNVYRNIGRMCGFPLSAIETYSKFTELGGMERTEMMQNVVLSPGEKAEMISSEVLPFALSFFMSRDNWKEEVKVAEQWAREIKLVAPELFERFINDYKR